jgi:hypothetical protein
MPFISARYSGYWHSESDYLFYYIMHMWENPEYGGPSNCFLGGTPIDTPNGSKRLEELVVGDSVWSGNQAGVEPVQVVALHAAAATNLVCLEVNNEQIWCTGEHPFWVCDQGWMPAKKLQRGYILVTADGAPVPVTRVGLEPANGPTKVYNLSVAGTHTFFVGKSRILVHNKDD